MSISPKTRYYFMAYCEGRRTVDVLRFVAAHRHDYHAWLKRTPIPLLGYTISYRKPYLRTSLLDVRPAWVVTGKNVQISFQNRKAAVHWVKEFVKGGGPQ